MRTAIIIAGALIAYAINPELWLSMNPPPFVAFGYLFLSLAMLAMDVVELGGKR